MNHDVTAVIPALNEALTIEEVVRGCALHAGTVVVLDGRSVDDTRERAERAGAQVFMASRPGKGAAIREIAPHLTTPFVVFIDADGSHVIDDIPSLLAPLREGWADHVQASRLIGGSSELHGSFDEFFRLAGSAFVTACINKRFSVRLSESQNGFRAMTTALLRQLDLQEAITTIEQEMVIKTLCRGARLLEVPSHEHKRRHGRSSIRLGKVWFRYGYSLVKYLFCW
ncbi:MAG: glycosyltransferase [Magnetococcales bacterium]|nr:glycosyltransferase [Magnetococcales bacterium]